ncbi:conserved oligomeric Golgi complex subunit 6-like isoform X1 [Penaeus japonicus]|uniref:conserved oligomeric Golgi complex subunit 6-like isoform X1 n=1 Tax=Penaeus japonicus TaxID=27405 RepID=UPI001C7128B9|nr:conserved oligomeric Golgi complex subunit 6-like isoform X1 [Penaeus japonicus]
MGGDTQAAAENANGERPQNNPLSRKINKILETRLENDKDTLDALKELSTFFTENTLRSRRNLRGEIEKRSVGISEEFVTALREVKEAVDGIYTEVSSMNEVCVDMKRRLQATKSETRHLIHQTNSLQNQSQKLHMQEEVALAFVKTFQLTPEEVLIIKGSSREAPITQEFFTVLDKTQKIRNNTKYLLQTGHQKTALDVMEQMNVCREAGLERLYRWCQSQCRSPDPSPLLTQALAALQERPVLFNLVVEEWVVVRRGWLVRGFLDALTIGGPGGAPRPIELQAHDPLRYVGDMLAWVHQALPSEREAAQTLFAKCSNIEIMRDIVGDPLASSIYGTNAKLDNPNDSQGSYTYVSNLMLRDVAEQTRSTVASISESVCRPLKTRIEQMIVTDQGREGGKKPVQLYKISNLLRFYHNTIKQVTDSGLLVATLDELHQLSYKMFISALQSQVTHLSERIEPPGETLAPTPGVARTLGLLTEVVTAATVADDAQQDFKQIVSCVVDPLVNAVNESAAGLGTVESAVYLLNCFHQLHSTLSLLHTTGDKLEMIQGQIDAQLDTLAQEQISGVCHSVGVAGMYPFISHPPPTPLSQNPACQPLAVQSFMTKLDGYLSAPDHLMLPHTRLLLSSSFRRTLHQRTAEALSSIYVKLHSLVHNPMNGYTDPSALLPRDPETVKNLLT